MVCHKSDLQEAQNPGSLAGRLQEFLREVTETQRLLPELPHHHSEHLLIWLILLTGSHYTCLWEPLILTVRKARVPLHTWVRGGSPPGLNSPGALSEAQASGSGCSRRKRRGRAECQVDTQAGLRRKSGKSLLLRPWQAACWRDFGSKPFS